MTALPKHIYSKKGVFYFQRRNWPTVRLTAQSLGEELMAERDAILNAPVAKLPPTQKAGEFESPDGGCHFKAMDASAKKRSARNDRQHDLPQGWAREQHLRQGGKCALTGVAFAKTRIKHAPHAPSIDRIDGALGYTPENCRLVTYIANCAKNQFAEAEFYAMCFAAIQHKAGL